MGCSIVMILAGLVFLLAYFTSYHAEGCTTGWFGDNCQYKCHCIGNSCQSNGECNQGVRCENGWFGPACQYADLTFTNATNSTPEHLLHGKDTTCNSDPSAQPATITLSGQFPFTWFRIRVNDAGVLEQPVTLEFKNSSSPLWLGCGNMKNVSVNDTTLDIYCDVTETADQVILKGDVAKSVCSLHISGGRNVALQQPTWQATFYTHTRKPSLAVDGNISGSENSCTHTIANHLTTQDDARWGVTLSQPAKVNRYVLYNRQDRYNNGTYCCRARLQGFKLQSLNQSGGTAFSYHDQKTEPQNVYTVTSPSSTVLVSQVNITATHTDSSFGPILTLCEVEIYGDSVCESGKYGRECKDTCRCDGGSECLVTGGCPAGCAAGYQGEICNISCLEGRYGVDCKKVCSTNCVEQKCNSVSGDCDKCPAGKKGKQCDEDCDPKTWGENCTNKCSTNCFEQLCNATTGVCLKCPSGKLGPQCDKDCPPNFYGDNCSLPCSNACLNQECNGTNGFCNSCPTGKTGKKCEEDCPFPTFGDNCRQTCSTTCGDDGSCHPVSGHCSNGCVPGYTGATCQNKCDNGRYGKDCGEQCSEYCNSNRTGPNESPCDHIDGKCVDGCQTGYQEPTCEFLVSPGNGDGGTSSPTGAIIGAVVAAAVVITLIVLGVILWRKRKANKADPPLTSGTYANVGPLTNTQEGLVNAAFETDSSPATRQNAAEPTGMTVNHYEKTKAIKPEVKPKPVPPVKPKEILNSMSTNSSEGNRGKAGPYYNSVNTVTDNSTTTVVAVEDLEVFMATHGKEFYRQQFSRIPNNKNGTTVVGLYDINKNKNRYKNICAYDHSRVHLEISDEKNLGDYVNANYIEGYKAEERFIASQGPTPVIRNDFIRMLWEQGVEKVVMLTNLIEEGKTKCERYWPEDDAMTCGEITVTLTVTDVFADYTIRRLRLSKDGEPARSVTQFHFTSWPDKGVPTLAWGLVDFEQRVFVVSQPASRPIVVHCSAGVGRTGTFIALRNVMREAEDTGQMDFFSTVEKLRKDRINMVQTSEQYEFLHRAAQVAMMCMGTTVTAGDIQMRITDLQMRSATGQSYMEKEFKAICAVCDDVDDSSKEEVEADCGESVYQNSRNAVNKLKNRLSNILPKEYYRVMLACEQDGLGDYINAVLVPSFRMQGQQILTQLPLPTTVTDFWRLVTQRRVSLIVAFELGLKAKDSSIGDYLPPSGDEDMAVSIYNIKTEEPTPGELWETQKVIVNTDNGRKTRKSAPVILDGQLRLTHFKANTTDLDPEKLLTLVTEIRSSRPVGEGSTLYMCRNGADYSGLVCVLSLLLDRMDNDHRLTVPLVVGAIKSIRPQVIPTLAQYNLLYEVLKLYSESKNVYSNMG